MKRTKTLLLLAALLLSWTLAGCGGAQPAVEAAPPGETEAPAPSFSPVPATPTPAPTPTPEPTPDMSPLPDEWFDDAVFLGDSISSTLEHYCERYEQLEGATFLCESSYSVTNAIYERVTLWYQGESGRVDKVIARTGANKVFIMLGTNEVAMDGGVDGAIERWNILLNMISWTNPDVTVFIESCLPMYYEAQGLRLNNEALDEYNRRLRELCEERGMVFVDIAWFFKDERNALKPEYCQDYYVHITREAAGYWLDLLRDPANYSVDPRSIDYGTRE